MVNRETETSGAFGRPVVHDRSTLGAEIQENRLVAYVEKLADEIASEGPMGRLLKNYPDLMLKLRNRLSREYQSMLYGMRNNLPGEEMSEKDLREALLKKGYEITSEIFNAHKDEIERGEDQRFRRAS